MAGVRVVQACMTKIVDFPMVCVDTKFLDFVSFPLSQLLCYTLVPNWEPRQETIGRSLLSFGHKVQHFWATFQAVSLCSDFLKTTRSYFFWIASSCLGRKDSKFFSLLKWLFSFILNYCLFCLPLFCFLSPFLLTSILQLFSLLGPFCNIAYARLIQLNQQSDLWLNNSLIL